MLKKDLLEKIKNAKDDEDINALLGGTDIESTFKSSGLTLDAFKEKMKSDKDFKAYGESENDKYYAKAFKTWKENNLEKELEPFMNAKYPDLIKDPKDKKVLEMETKIAQMEKASARKDLLTEAMKYGAEKKLPAGFIDKFLGEDLDTTKANLDVLAVDWSKGLEASVSERMKAASYIPGGTDKSGEKLSIGASMAQQNNGSKTAPSDPWATK